MNLKKYLKKLIVLSKRNLWQRTPKYIIYIFIILTNFKIIKN